MNNSSHQITLWTLKGKYWKWRMHGAAVSFAERFNKEQSDVDLILCTDMMDLAAFKGLVKSELPKTAVYFHENQIIYPWQENSEDAKKGRDMHYAFINYTSCLAAAAVFFNSLYHKNAFISELEAFLKAYPDERNLDAVKVIKSKSQVLHLGMNLDFFDKYKSAKEKKATFLWNHRHEHDKNPEGFFEPLFKLSEQGFDFQLIVLGESYANSPDIFGLAKEKLSNHIVHWGFAEDRKQYTEMLWRSTHIPVTSYHDFFGASLIEAAYCDVVPILPNRLVYPEHFQEASLFYDSDEELIGKLKAAIKNPVGNSQRAEVEKYKWPYQIRRYDKAFDDLVC